MTKQKGIKIELIWMAGVAIIAALLVELMIGWRNGSIDIQLHDTYFILHVRHAFVLFLLTIAFWLYLVRQIKEKFRNLPANIVLLVVAGMLIFITSLTIQFIGYMREGWTIYPPASSSPAKVPEMYSITMTLNLWIQVYELFQLLVFGFTGVMTGRAIEIHLRNKGRR